ncbi:E3 ubiquitin-protein ligase TRIM21-like [Nematolebias whitei]|uniref:E3 ubiquitin-protein ligase TRIM21-like n=1 Tax=Nematolebias whitei TaxID=451745 RepID=UPI0018990E07|nr:E3 ubiquitin-protein ligase TRIM21-like [Nematolebias whitei]
MATGSSFLSEDQFLCSVCLDILTDPVTVPCGHNFCRSCIAEDWSISTQQQCLVCRKIFDTKPALRINTVISDMAAHFRSSSGRRATRISQGIFPEDVPCGVCTKSKQKAVKSCLDCLSSYCETHLEPHHRISSLRRHTLVDPVENLENRMCKKHKRPLDMFCRTDQMSICQSCTVADHKRHEVVPLIKECKWKKKELERTGANVQQMIQERLLKIEQIKQSVKLSKEDVEDVTAAVVEDCSTLIKSARRNLDLLIDVIKRKQKTVEKQAEGFMKELEEEISELMKKSSELKSLSQTEDHLQLLRNLPSLKVRTKDWTNIRVESSCDGTVRRAAAELETLSRQMKKLCDEVELSKVQLYVVDVTLDQNTANPYLVLSEDGKQVSCGEIEQNLPNKSERLPSFAVLGEQAFSSGRFYYEVQVQGKSKWELGVVRESFNRRGENTICPENGFWVVWLRNGQYRALTGPSVPLHLKCNPQKVGVFVDYNKGLVCFYDPDTAALIYSFTNCKFREKLFPFFSPCSSDGGKNSNPLIISTTL